MEMIQQLWPFIGLCGGAAALAFVVLRAVMPSPSPKIVLTNSKGQTLTEWQGQPGKYTTLPAGQKYILHVSKSAIGYNMKYGYNFPTSVVYDEAGKKHEFHEVWIGPANLVFDREGETANVYFITHDAVIGRHIPNQPTSFIEKEDIPKSKQFKNRVEVSEETRQKLVDLEHMVIARDRLLIEKDVTIENLTRQITEGEEITENGYKEAYEIIKSLQQSKEQESLQHQEALQEANQSKRQLPLAERINFPNQTRSVIKTREVRHGRGCSVWYENVSTTEQTPLKYGDEGFVDADRQEKFVRIRQVSIGVSQVPLEEGDPGYREPYVPC